MLIAQFSRKRPIFAVPPLPARAVEPRLVPSNPPFTVYVPISTAEIGGVGNAPLPATSAYNERLEMRRPFDLRGGFRLQKSSNRQPVD